MSVGTWIGWHSDSMIVLDFMREGTLSRVWYVLQNVSSDLSGGGEDGK